MVLILDSGHGGSSVLIGCGDHGEGLKLTLGTVCLMSYTISFGSIKMRKSSFRMMYRDVLANDTDSSFWPRVVAAAVSRNRFEARKSSKSKVPLPH